MSQILASPFRKTLVAVAVVALTSGCATTTAEGPGHGGIGESIARAGQKTAGFGQTVWHRTGYLLGLHDDPGVPMPGEPVAAEPARAVAGFDRPAPRTAPAPSSVPVAKLPLHLDEVDLALMEEDAPMPGAIIAPTAFADADPLDAMEVMPFEDDAVGEVELLAATAPDPFDPLGLDRISPPTPAALLEELDARQGFAAAMPALDPAVEAPIASAPAPMPTATAAAAPAVPVAVVAAADLEHRVGEAETLWDIAKTTTGDATNWHTLADVNDLGPGASVYPGQVLTIPADMVRPELVGVAALADASVVELPSTVAPIAEPAAAEPAAAAAAPTTRLSIPAAASPTAVPTTEPADGASPFVIASGETLWDFAKRTTGDATNWQAIATQNGFDERAAVSVREGQQIFVPTDMVVERGTAVAEAADVFVPIPSVGDTRTVDESVDASASALADASAAEAATGTATTDAADMRIVEAAFTGGPAADLPEPAVAAAGPDDVVISGTYYPKAIYSDADFSAGLLMRASPGTRLKVSRVDGKWFEVETERGSGWVHERDVN